MANNIDIKLTVDTSTLHKELDAVVSHTKAVKKELSSTGIVGAFFNFFCGRCTTFAIIFSGVGIYLAVAGKLTADYVAFVGAIQALLLAHSAKEDYHQRACVHQDGGDGQ